MTTFYLVRHATHRLLDSVLAGRTIDVELNPAGQIEARMLAKSFGRCLSSIYTSPRRRAIETATIVASYSNVPVEVALPLDEVDFGRWSGCSFAELDTDPSWRRWNDKRDARAPGGEGVADALSRIKGFMSLIHRAHPVGQIALFTHAEVIRALLLDRMSWPFCAWPLVDVPPASVTSLEIEAEPISHLVQNDEAAVGSRRCP